MPKRLTSDALFSPTVRIRGTLVWPESLGKTRPPPSYVSVDISSRPVNHHYVNPLAMRFVAMLNLRASSGFRYTETRYINRVTYLPSVPSGFYERFSNHSTTTWLVGFLTYSRIPNSRHGTFTRERDPTDFRRRFVVAFSTEVCIWIKWRREIDTRSALQ